MEQGKLEKFVMPLMVFAAIVTVWLLFRNSGTVATSAQPNASASGVPSWTPQAQQYAVNPSQYTPSPIVMMADPYSQDPQGNAQGNAPKLPQYLSFNFGPSHDLTKVPTEPDVNAASAHSGCGGSCCGCEKDSCDQNPTNNFPDGAGATPLASTRKRQIERAPRDWFEVAYHNFIGVQLPEDTPHPTGTNQAPVAPAANIPAATPHLQSIYTGPIHGIAMSLN